MDLKSFDFRSLNKFLSAQASDDLNKFLEQLPTNAGKSVLIAAGIAWGAVAALSLNMFVQTKQLTEMRGEIEKAEAVQPVVPVIKSQPVDPAAVKAWAEEATKLYSSLTINANNNTVSVMAKDTAAYAEFREALGHALNGGQGWKVNLEGFCLGRECVQNSLEAVLKIEKLSIDKPSS